MEILAVVKAAAAAGDVGTARSNTDTQTFKQAFAIVMGSSQR